MDKKMFGFEVVAGAVIGVLGALAMFGYGVYWLVDRAAQGDQAATMIVSFLVFIVLMVFGLLAYFSIGMVQSKLQSRAAQDKMMLMRENAIENQEIMNQVQKGLLLFAQTQQQQGRAGIADARLTEIVQRLTDGNQQQAQPRYLGFGSSQQSDVIEAAFKELGDD